MQTRSGAVFSPYDVPSEVVNTDAKLGEWLKDAFMRELRRDEAGVGDAEGWPILSSSPGGSPMTSPPLELPTSDGSPPTSYAPPSTLRTPLPASADGHEKKRSKARKHKG